LEGREKGEVHGGLLVGEAADWGGLGAFGGWKSAFARGRWRWVDAYVWRVGRLGGAEGLGGRECWERGGA